MGKTEIVKSDNSLEKQATNNIVEVINESEGVAEEKKDSVKKIIENDSLTLEQKLSDIRVWGKKYGLDDIESKIEKVISENRLFYISKNKVRYTTKQGKVTVYPLKKMVEVAMEIGDWKGQMAVLGITEKEVLGLFLKMYDKYCVNHDGETK